MVRLHAGDFVRADAQILDGYTPTVITLNADYFVEIVEYFDEAVESTSKSHAVHTCGCLSVVPNAEKIRHANVGIRNKILGAAIALRVLRVDCVIKGGTRHEKMSWNVSRNSLGYFAQR